MEDTDKEVFVAMLQKFISILDAYEGNVPPLSNHGQTLDGYAALHNYIDVSRQARALINNPSMFSRSVKDK